MYELSAETTFAAAHRLREYRGKCENLHGHNYRVRVVIQADRLDGLGMVMDFGDVKRLLHEAVSPFDHVCLNDLDCFKEQNPTAENIARILFEEMSRRLPPEARAHSVTCYESDRCGVTYRA